MLEMRMLETSACVCGCACALIYLSIFSQLMTLNLGMGSLGDTCKEELMGSRDESDPTASKGTYFVSPSLPNPRNSFKCQ